MRGIGAPNNLLGRGSRSPYAAADRRSRSCRRPPDGCSRTDLLYWGLLMEPDQDLPCVPVIADSLDGALKRRHLMDTFHLRPSGCVGHLDARLPNPL